MHNNNGAPDNKFWTAFWGSIIVLAVIYFAAVYESSKIEVIDNGQRVLLSDELAKTWQQTVLPHIFKTLDTEEVRTKEEIDGLIDARIDAIFSPVYGQISRFADFHYSVSGEYEEILAALTGDLGNRAHDILFKQVDFDTHLKNGFNDIYEQSNLKLLGAMGRVNADMQTKMSLNDSDMNVLTKTLNLSIQDVKNRFSNLTYSTIRSVGVGVGVAAAGTVLAKTMGKKLATKVTAKMAVKTTAKAGGILGGAGAGAGICAAGGPLAIVACGVVGGIAVWFAVDKFIVEIDESLHRKEFEQEIRNMVDEQKLEIKQGLKKAYADALAVIGNEQKTKIKSGVVTPMELILN